MTTLSKHISIYSVAGILSTVASLISFPILTRLLSVEQYGILSTVSITLALMVSISKLGIQKSILRYFPGGKEPTTQGGSQDRMYSTVFIGVTLFAFTFVATYATVLISAFQQLDRNNVPAAMLILVLPIVFTQVIESGILNLEYASERSRFLAIYGVVKRYWSLGVTILALYAFDANAKCYLVALVLAELCMFVVLLRLFFARHRILPSAFSSGLLTGMVTFGIPMLGVELSWSLLSIGDRYVIQNLLGNEAVGIYAASYNLCEYIKGATIVAFGTALSPIFMRIWGSEGKAGTERLLGVASEQYFAFALLVATLVSASSEPLIRIVASEKYLEGVVIVPWVMFGMVLEGFVTVAAAGVFIAKRSAAILSIVVCSAVLNIILNYALVPRLGLLGAAMATLLSFAMLVALSIRVGRAYLYVRVPWRCIIIGTTLFLLSSNFVTSIYSGNYVVDIFLRSALIVLAFSCSYLPLFENIRRPLEGVLISILDFVGYRAKR